MMKNTNQPEIIEAYEAPVIYTIEVRVEGGFQLSEDESDDMTDPKGKGSW